MFGISGLELLVIAVVALVVIGPKDLPRAMRAFGYWSGKVTRTAREFRRQFDEALREAELDSLRREVEAIGKPSPPLGGPKEPVKIEAGGGQTGPQPTAAKSDDLQKAES
jgi:sec-independent protein translocase protein TatB